MQATLLYFCSSFETEIVRNQTHRNCSDHIDHRVLLQKQCGGTNQQSCCAEKQTPRQSTELFHAPRCTPYGHRAYDVQRRTDIGIGIKLIKVVQKAGKQIIPIKCVRTQLLTGWKHEINHRNDGKGNDDKPHQFLKRINIIKQCIKVHPDQIYKPKQIRDNEKLTKWNVRIPCTGYGIVGIDR